MRSLSWVFRPVRICTCNLFSPVNPTVMVCSRQARDKIHIIWTQLLIEKLWTQLLKAFKSKTSKKNASFYFIYQNISKWEKFNFYGGSSFLYNKLCTHFIINWPVLIDSEVNCTCNMYSTFSVRDTNCSSHTLL